MKGIRYIIVLAALAPVNVHEVVFMPNIVSATGGSIITDMTTPTPSITNFEAPVDSALVLYANLRH